MSSSYSKLHVVEIYQGRFVSEQIFSKLVTIPISLIYSEDLPIFALLVIACTFDSMKDADFWDTPTFSAI